MAWKAQLNGSTVAPCCQDSSSGRRWAQSDADLEALGGGAADREAEVVGAAVDRALADDAVARADVAYLRADRDDLAGPLVTWDDRELHGDDVAVGEEVEVGVADAHLARGDEHLVATDFWLGELGDLGPLRSGENECLHDIPLLLAVANRLQSIAAVDKRGPSMKAARYHGRLDIRIEDVPVPVPADDELLLEVAAVGICGTDAAEFAHGPTMFPIDHAHPVTGHRGPMVPGHEFAGRVVAAGRDVSGFAEGDLVTSGAGVSCGVCGNCRAGRTNLCDRYFTIGLNRDGALAELAAVPARACVGLAERRLTGDVAAMAQPMSIAVHAMRRGRPAADEHAVVDRCRRASEPSSCTRWRATAPTSTAVDLDGDRLAVATELGAASDAADDERGAPRGSTRGPRLPPDGRLRVHGSPGGRAGRGRRGRTWRAGRRRRAAQASRPGRPAVGVARREGAHRHARPRHRCRSRARRRSARRRAWRTLGPGRSGRRPLGGGRQRRVATDDRGRRDADQTAPRPAHRRSSPARAMVDM